MGELYYLRKKKPRMVKVYDTIYLGKASVGWKFKFRVQPEFKNFEEFKKLMDTGEYDVVDFHDNKIPEKEFWKMIEYHQNEKNEFVDGEYEFIDEDFS